MKDNAALLLKSYDSGKVTQGDELRRLKSGRVTRPLKSNNASYRL